MFIVYNYLRKEKNTCQSSRMQEKSTSKHYIKKNTLKRMLTKSPPPILSNEFPDSGQCSLSD